MLHDIAAPPPLRMPRFGTLDVMFWKRTTAQCKVTPKNLDEQTRACAAALSTKHCVVAVALSSLGRGMCMWRLVRGARVTRSNFLVPDV